MIDPVPADSPHREVTAFEIVAPIRSMVGGRRDPQAYNEPFVEKAWEPVARALRKSSGPGIEFRIRRPKYRGEYGGAQAVPGFDARCAWHVDYSPIRISALARHK